MNSRPFGPPSPGSHRRRHAQRAVLLGPPRPRVHGRGRAQFDHRLGRYGGRKLGLYAPPPTIAAARVEADRTEATRERQRASNERQRAKAEDAYRTEFAAAVVAWLGFAPEHEQLASEIADTAASRAVEVGSGRVGRTKTLPLEERAALAARATIRHRFTVYEDALVELDPFESEFDDSEYRAAKKEAHQAVDAFLDAHRPPSGDA